MARRAAKASKPAHNAGHHKRAGSHHARHRAAKHKARKAGSRTRAKK